VSRRAAARLAGLAFLLYIAVGILTLMLSSRAMAGHGVEAKLASVAQHMPDLRIAVLFVSLALTLTTFQEPPLRGIASRAARAGTTC